MDTAIFIPQLNPVPHRPADDWHRRYRGLSVQKFIGIDDAHPLCLDPGFGIMLEDVLQYQIRNVSKFTIRPPVTPALATPEAVFVEITDGVLLLEAASTRPIGIATYGNIVVVPEYRGRGLGAELLVEYLLRGGSAKPPPDVDGLYFTESGLGNRRRALALLQDDGYCQQKHQALHQALHRGLTAEEAELEYTVMDAIRKIIAAPAPVEPAPAL